MKKELKTSEIQEMLRSGISKNQISSDYNVDEKLLDSFSKMVELEKQFVVESLNNFIIKIDDSAQTFKSLVDNAWAKIGSADYKPIWLISKKNRQPWQIEINLSPTFVINYFWQPAIRLLEAKDDYAKELLDMGYIANTQKAAGELKVDKINSKELDNNIDGYNPFQADKPAFDNQALTEVIDFTDVRKSVDVNLKKDKDKADKEKADKEKADKEKADKEKVDKEKVDKERVNKELKKEDVKDSNSTTSVENAEIGKGKTVKSPSERIPVPSWDDIILGGA
ncbi:MAG: DUF3071 domain-containing protein [Bifidobacteriaceae bacterium]|jgi:hypothetical protein|nr:DUF3071 domain-containing protein [Bifidobacteriaceae bacterium]